MSTVHESQVIRPVEFLPVCSCVTATQVGGGVSSTPVGALIPSQSMASTPQDETVTLTFIIMAVPVFELDINRVIPSVVPFCICLLAHHRA